VRLANLHIFQGGHYLCGIELIGVVTQVLEASLNESHGNILAFSCQSEYSSLLLPVPQMENSVENV